MIMKKLVFLFLFITNNAFAQYVPFNLQRRDNIGVFHQSLEKFDRVGNEANEQYRKLQLMLAEYGDKLYNDEETQLWYYNYKKNIERNYESLKSLGPYDARDYAIRKQGEIANDPELMARIRTTTEYYTALRNIQQRSDMSQQEKKDWMLEHPYCFIPIVNREGEIIGGRLGTIVELDVDK